MNPLGIVTTALPTSAPSFDLMATGNCATIYFAMPKVVPIALPTCASIV